MTLDQIALHDLTWLAVAFLIVAVLYSMVGHGGGSGYLAVMALAGFAELAMQKSGAKLVKHLYKGRYGKQEIGFIVQKSLIEKNPGLV